MKGVVLQHVLQDFCHGPGGVGACIVLTENGKKTLLGTNFINLLEGVYVATSLREHFGARGGWAAAAWRRCSGGRPRVVRIFQARLSPPTSDTDNRQLELRSQLVSSPSHSLTLSQQLGATFSTDEATAMHATTQFFFSELT